MMYERQPGCKKKSGAVRTADKINFFSPYKRIAVFFLCSGVERVDCCTAVVGVWFVAF